MTEYERLKQYDFIEKIRPLFDKGWYICPIKHKLVRRTPVYAPDIPWMFMHQQEMPNCDRELSVGIMCMGIIPTKCLSCWKIKISVSNVLKLVKLRDVLKKLGLPCKCGVELRTAVMNAALPGGGKYSGYIYCDSKEQGLDRFHMVSAAVNKVDKKAKLILKRGCTELEEKRGPSDEWEQTEEDLYWQEQIDEYVEGAINRVSTPSIVEDHIKHMWIVYANRQGDRSALAFNDGKSLQTQFVTYHNKSEK